MNSVGRVMLFSAAAVLSACGGSSGDEIWSDDSQQIEIVRFNGNVPPPEPPTTTFIRLRSELPTQTLAILKELDTTSEVSCPEDEETYTLSVIDNDGKRHTYYSSNKACPGIAGDGFIPKQELDNLVATLS